MSVVMLDDVDEGRPELPSEPTTSSEASSDDQPVPVPSPTTAATDATGAAKTTKGRGAPPPLPASASSSDAGETGVGDGAKQETVAADGSAKVADGETGSEDRPISPGEDESPDEGGGGEDDASSSAGAATAASATNQSSATGGDPADAAQVSADAPSGDGLDSAHSSDEGDVPPVPDASHDESDVHFDDTEAESNQGGSARSSRRSSRRNSREGDDGGEAGLGASLRSGAARRPEESAEMSRASSSGKPRRKHLMKSRVQHKASLLDLNRSFSTDLDEVLDLDVEVARKTGSEFIAHIRLFDGRTTAVKVKGDWTVSLLREYIARKIDLVSHRYLELCEPIENGVLRWLHPERTLEEEGVTGDTMLQLYVKWWKEPNHLKDSACLGLLYRQVRSAVADGTLRVSESQAIRLASYCVQEQYGEIIDNDGISTRTLSASFDARELQSMMPADLVDSMPAEYWSNRLLSIHRKYDGKFGGKEAQLKFLEFARQLPMFGLSFYDAVAVVGSGKPDVAMQIGVSEDGLFEYGPDPERVFRSFTPFSHLRGWVLVDDGIEILRLRHVGKPRHHGHGRSRSVSRPHHASGLSRNVSGATLGGSNGYSIGGGGGGAGGDGGASPMGGGGEDMPGPTSTAAADMHGSGDTDHDHDLDTPEALTYRTSPVVARMVAELLTGYYELQVRLQERSEEGIAARLALITTNLADVHVPPVELFLPSARRKIRQTVFWSRLEVFKHKLVRGFAEANLHPLPHLWRLIDDTLDNNRWLEEVDMSDCGVTDAVLEAVMSALAAAYAYNPLANEELVENLRCVTINLRANGLTHRGAAAMGARLRALPAPLERVILFDNPSISNKGLTKLAPDLSHCRRLQHLNIGGCDVGNKGMHELCTVLCELPHVNTLIACRNRIEDKSWVAPFEALVARAPLVHLDLSHNKLGDAALEALCAGLQARGSEVSLQYLNLSENRFDKRAMARLAGVISGLDSLHTLGYADNKCSSQAVDALVQMIASMPGLVDLDISGCSLGRQAKDIFEVLAGNPTLMQLNIANNGIDSKATPALMEMVANNTALTSLDVTGNKLSTKKLSWAAAIEANSTMLVLSMADVGMKAGDIKAFSEGLAANRTLRSLDLSNNNVGDRGMQDICLALETNYALHTLHLNHTKIGDKGLIYLSKIKHNRCLANLSLEENSISGKSTAKFVEALEGNSALKRIHLYGNSLASAADFAEAIEAVDTECLVFV